MVQKGKEMNKTRQVKKGNKLKNGDDLECSIHSHSF